MIFELHNHPHFTKGKIIAPVSCNTSEMYLMLDKAFPYTPDSHNNKYGFWQFFICNYGRENNAIQFI